ncbi:hypothetical protein K440DRAFT_639229 [Wilcoxina mikolae CBS 423.85]|nr:hypothetical protein K440DRAFT_639229 [Wilcoxina mikolae CBS 423.85]
MGVIRLRQLGVQQDVANVGSTFSSWDKCMEKSYCKYPLIVGCIIAGFFIISMLMCLFRCIMCGYACCSCCCGGCGGNGGRRHKEVTTTYVLPPPAPIIDRPPPPPPPPPQMHPQPPPHDYGEPKYAYFDKPSDDALPHMPSARGIDVKQEVEESHEMVNVRRSPSPQAAGIHAPPPMRRPGEVYPGQPPPSAAPNYYPAGAAVSSPYNAGNGPYVQTRPHLPPQGPYAGEERNTPDYYPAAAAAVFNPHGAGSGPYVQTQPHLVPQGPYASGINDERNTPDYYPTGTADPGPYNAGNGSYVQTRPHLEPYAGTAGEERNAPRRSPSPQAAGIHVPPSMRPREAYPSQPPPSATPDYFPTGTTDSSSYNAADELHLPTKPHEASRAQSPLGAADEEKNAAQKPYQRREYQRQEYQAYSPNGQKKPEEWSAL